ncbi:hypothetical protein [Antribacter soli]|nr:hypothetical protein [Antribacter soli]
MNNMLRRASVVVFVALTLVGTASAAQADTGATSVINPYTVGH